MKVGDLVRINDLNESDSSRMIGTIIQHDIYDRQFKGLCERERIAEVLWNSGKISWILTKRLELVNELDARRDKPN